MEVEGENKKQMRPEDRGDTWFQTSSYKFRRMQWDSPFPADREDRSYGQNLQSPLLPSPAPADPVPEGQPEPGAAMEVEVEQ